MAHVTMIHGIANKPPADVLLRQWERTLAAASGIDLGTQGITTSMVYWADVLYDSPGVARSAAEAVALDEALEETDASWKASLPEAERRFVERMEASLDVRVDEPEAPESQVREWARSAEALERVPLPGPIKRRLMKKLLRDVHHYLFDVLHSPRTGEEYRVRAEIRSRFVKAVKEGAVAQGPHVVVSHSMGTVIAYDCLKRVADCPAVDALVTIGSPLGLDEIQDEMRPEWSRDDGYPGERVPVEPGAWVNVFDRLDPVAGFDPSLVNDYAAGGERLIIDIHEPNQGLWRHNIDNYLRGPLLRTELRRLLSLE